MARSIEDLKKTIAGLLAKAERTDNEHERDTYNEQAERMMLRLGIERAELESVGEVKPEEIVEVRKEWTGNYSITMVDFVAAVARGFGNLTILQSKNHNGMLRTTFIIGHKSDVEEFCRLIDSLHLQVMSALKRWQRENREERRWLTDMEKYTQHRSFISAFGSAVRRRLQAERVEEEKVATPGAALVLASKMDRVTAWKNEQYTDLRNARTGARTWDSQAAGAGAEAGRRASLGEKAVGGTRGALDA